MTAVQLVVLATTTVLAVAHALIVPRLWSGAYRPPHHIFELFVPASIARGTIRALPVNSVLVGLLAAFLVARWLVFPDGRPSVIVDALAVGAVATLLVEWSIILLNRPRWLVPPYLRSDPGAIHEWSRRRRRGPPP